jgi:uncharacterized protein (TIGR03067 family)
MTRIATLVVVALLSAGVAAQNAEKTAKQSAPADAKKTALDKAFAPLQGAWIVNDINGQTPESMSLVFKGDQYEHVVNGEVVERGAIKLDAAKKPIAIDLVIQEGTDAGKLQPGIVEVTGDTMKLKLAAPADTTRPKTFDTEEGFMLVSLTKQK